MPCLCFPLRGEEEILCNRAQAAMLFDDADSDTNDAVTFRVPDQKSRRGQDTPCYIWGKDMVSADVWHPACPCPYPQGAPLLLLLCRSTETAAGKAPAAAQTKQSSDVFVDLTLSDEESADGEAASAPACKKGVCLRPNRGLL